VSDQHSANKLNSLKAESGKLKAESSQLAALPSFGGPNSSALLNQLPSIGATLPSVPKWGNSVKKSTLKFPKKFQSLIDAIPLLYGSVQDVYDSQASPKIGYAGASSAVVLIQDVHLNAEAQTNIAAILQELIDQKQVGLVGVEGAFAALDFSR